MPVRAVQPEALKVPEWTLGDRLRKARTSAQIEREDMARRFGVTVGAISKWETDAREPAIDVVNKWADITNVPAWWLFGIRSTIGYKHTPLTPRLQVVR